MVKYIFTLFQENIMAVNPWKASQDVLDLVHEVYEKHHAERLHGGLIGVCFDDSKPFVKNKLNLGKVTKFSPLAKLWQGTKLDFCISISMDLWHSVLTAEQREAYIDLQLSRCGVEYLPEEIEENGKKKVVKDEFGRVHYTNQVKLDDEGNPKWKILPLDLEVFASNVRRYGLWQSDLLDLKDAIISVGS